VLRPLRTGQWRVEGHDDDAEEELTIDGFAKKNL
jgi:hypothetical protein